jgi:hypothetical protein
MPSSGWQWPNAALRGPGSLWRFLLLLVGARTVLIDGCSSGLWHRKAAVDLATYARPKIDQA